MIATAVRNGLFLAFNAISGRPSEESCIGTHAPDRFFAVRLVVDIEFVAMHGIFFLLTSKKLIVIATAAYCIHLTVGKVIVTNILL